MKKVILLIFSSFLIYSVQAAELEDFKFILGLHRDGNFALAEIELEKFIGHYPESEFRMDARYLLAGVRLQQKNYQAALQDFRELYSSYTEPGVRDGILLGLAQALFFTNNYEAGKYFDLFLQDYLNHPLRWKAYYFKGRIAANEGNLEQALKLYNSATKESDDITIYRAELDIYLSQGKDKKIDKLIRNMADQDMSDITCEAIILVQDYYLAKQNYYHLLDNEIPAVPDNSAYQTAYRLNLAIARYETGEYEEALNDLKGIKTELSQFYQALCYLKLDDKLQAEDILSRLSESSPDEEIRAQSSFSLIGLEEDRNVIITKLQAFLKAFPGHEYQGDVYYQIGMNYFQLKDYAQAIVYFEKARQEVLDTGTEEGAQYLIAESNFLLDRLDSAEQEFTTYLADYPSGLHRDEAIFKIGLMQFNIKEYQLAQENFQRVIKEFPGSSKSGMCHFYLAEIAFLKAEYDQAKELYVTALTENSDQNLIWQRIGQIYYIEGTYDKAVNSVNKVSEDKEYQFNKSLLKGNIQFALGNYLNALDAFIAAETSAENENEADLARARQGRALYQLNRFAEASLIFESLAQNDSQGQDFLFQAANSAFSAADYQKAINLYSSYLQDYPEGNEQLSAWVGIADSYYNLSNFAKAAEVYKKILEMNIDERILRNSLNALEWSCEQTEQYDFIDEANNLVMNQDNADFKRIILVQKADYEFRKGRWDESINSLTEVKALTADHGLILDMELKIAQALVNLEQYDQAEKIYQRLGVEKKDPETFIYWAQMKLRQKNEMEATEKMRQAALLTRNNDIWLQLLELSINSGHPQFLDDYHKFLEFGSEDNIARAKIYWLKWKIERQQFAETDLVLKNLLAGKDKWVKANAQYLSGLSLYKQDKYTESIPELLRVRYLYPDLVEVRSEAETVACLAYLKAGNKEEAEKLFKSIEEEITPDQRKLISDAIGEAGN